jgi:hypothetical protein
MNPLITKYKSMDPIDGLVIFYYINVKSPNLDLNFLSGKREGGKKESGRKRDRQRQRK